jgi:succinate dehydrogenase / fumarate reductase cytochrome b subunit
LKEPKLNWLTGFLKSSVGRKFVMAFTGLFLCFFLVVHLAGNLMLYVGGEAYNNYAEKLHSNEEFLVIAEVLLFSAFALHIALAWATTWENYCARKKSYKLVETKRDDRSMSLTSSADYTMMITGMIGLFFLAVHISDFKLEFGWEVLLEGQSPAQKVGIILTNGTRALIYILGSIAFGIHVSHGLASACQTIGFNHPKYTPTINVISIIFGWIVALGFGSFPIIANLYPDLWTS